MKQLFLYIAAILCFAACSNEVSQQLEPKGAALGKMNEIVVICDKNIWESAVGDTFQFYFESAYPILPAPEPLFDLRHFTIEDLQKEPLRKELRSYVILADLKDDDSPTTRMVKDDIGGEKVYQLISENKWHSTAGRDKWARGQILFYLVGAGHDQIINAITKHFSTVARRVNKHDEKQLKSYVYVDRINQGLSEKIKHAYGVDFQVPGDYQIASEDSDNKMIWLRKDTDEAILNLVIQRIPYNNQNQLTKDSIIAYRNRFGSQYVDSDVEDDVMVVNSKDLPVYEYQHEIDGHYTKEIRGVWEMTKAYAGGPFITYLIVDEKSQSLIYIDTFILAPGEAKRNLMMQLDYIVKSMKLNTIG